MNIIELKNLNYSMSKFQSKVNELKESLSSKINQNCSHNVHCHTVTAYQMPSHSCQTKKDVFMQQPIIIQKKVKQQEQKNKSVIKKAVSDKRLAVEPFMPVKIAQREKKKINTQLV